MEYLRGPLYLDIAGKGLGLVGVLLMILGQGEWFIVGVIVVVTGVLCGAWSMVVVRRMRSPSGFTGPTYFRARNPEDNAEDSGRNP